MRLIFNINLWNKGNNKKTAEKTPQLPSEQTAELVSDNIMQMPNIAYLVEFKKVMTRAQVRDLLRADVKKLNDILNRDHVKHLVGHFCVMSYQEAIALSPQQADHLNAVLAQDQVRILVGICKSMSWQDAMALTAQQAVELNRRLGTADKNIELLTVYGMSGQEILALSPLEMSELSILVSVRPKQVKTTIENLRTKAPTDASDQPLAATNGPAPQRAAVVTGITKPPRQDSEFKS